MTIPMLQALEADGTPWDDPTEEQLHDLLANMTLTWRFVIVRRLDLEPADQHYMQVHLNDDLSYQLEYREGGPDKHFQACFDTRDQGPFAVEPVAEVLRDWAFGRSSWRQALPWVPFTALPQPGSRVTLP
ncbi:hypothetical protein [Streptomyces sp. Ncost-T10-10d]|uniref:hypothetical protein n=1 Tax=Streptomyces sp. Ncost-T10-10d TaxID=1839774 RepID=UPI00081E6B50|nr:hypothetical protein [Streptomyces sp. Ncost-T10-10d]SCF72783.1 hypothetical protein GA0115254_11387 [Streptomyces sp. Ncost-T10-10d]